MIYRFLADVVVALDVAYVLAVVLGLLVILLGRVLRWQWVRNRWFRLVHLALIGLVIVRAAIWPVCPLTEWEQGLRELGGQVDFEGSAVGRFLHALIHPALPLWVFPLVYVLFGILVVVAFWVAPVRWRPDQNDRPVE